MADSTLTLCATSRLAQTLRGELPDGVAVARTRQALSVGQWLAALADEALLVGQPILPQALDADAERLLWEQVIADDLAAAAVDGAALFDLPGLAASAMEAHGLCRAWGLSAVARGSLASDEARRFAGWQAEFERRCAKGGWLDTAGVQAQLVDAIAAGAFALPAVVVFAGFDRPTPAERRLAEALAGRGCRVEYSVFSAVDRSDGQVFACPDAAAECRAAVDWVLRRRAADPAVRLAIVAPDLAGVRDRLAALLDDALHPAAIRPDGAGSLRDFNISLGRPLAEQPLVALGLDLLALGGGHQRIEQPRLSALLLAGFWAGSGAEADGRARLDAAIRRDLPWFVAPLAVPRHAERLASEDLACRHTLAALADGLAVLAEAPRSQLPGGWARTFRRALAAFGWPGERALSSHEYQAHQAFLELLAGFGRFDPLLGRLGAAAALARLRELCRRRVFQPETRGRPHIQVLGVLESAGLAFDGLWVMGMNDDRWPPPPRPNPLLPVDAQRAAGSAHASAEVELDFARRVQARLSRAAPEVHFSYARADGNRLLRPSPLLLGLPAAVDCDPAVETLADRLAGAPDCVALDDAQAPPVTLGDNPGETVRGGSWLLRAQAICPAWAFYQFRLGAEAMETPVEGLDPAARGTLVHGALEAFWREVGGADGLAALDEISLTATVDRAIAAALAAFEAAQRTNLPARFRTLEAARLQRLLLRWLAVEAARPQPFTVQACEEQASVDIEGIRVNMVVDRIDRLADGRRLILDYKTGAAIDTKNWAQARLTEPQLPIYAALLGADGEAAVVGVAFAKVLMDKPAFTGVAADGDLLPGVAGLGDAKQKVFPVEAFPDWNSVVTHWRQALHNVADEVRRGVAGVRFADPGDLRYCEVLPLLRLSERQRLLAAAQRAAGGQA